MAIQSNSSEVQIAGGGIPLYTGIAPVSVIAVNPSLAELHALDINLKTEPNYTGIQLGDNVKNKLTFWLKAEVDDVSFTTRLEMLVGAEHRPKSKTGKFQMTNKLGQVTWAVSPDEAPEWFKRDGLRRTYPGEETLINFTKAWANIPNDGECSFDTIDEIVKGNVTELRTLVTALKDNKLRVMLGVKDGKYQQVYNRCFGRLKPARKDVFIRSLNDEYGTFNADYNESLDFVRYEPTVVTATEETPAPVETADSWM
tara:strand:- start:506 stop:1273 length:768 start_codon:yes stop_codon:yes gene_type:complete